MSELVGGKNRWTLPLDPPYRAARRLLFVSELGNPCGSAFSVGALDLRWISVFHAARRRLCWNLECSGFRVPCGSALPVCYPISVFRAARRLLVVLVVAGSR